MRNVLLALPLTLFSLPSLANECAFQRDDAPRLDLDGITDVADDLDAIHRRGVCGRVVVRG